MSDDDEAPTAWLDEKAAQLRDHPIYYEPPAVMKDIAATTRQVFNSLAEVGFEQDQAFALTKIWWERIHGMKADA